MDEAICRTRVVTQDWAGAQASVKKCATAYFAYLNAVDSSSAAGPESGAAVAAAYDKLLLEIEQYELSMIQLERVAARCEAEAEHYRAVNGEVDESLARVSAEVAALKAQLDEERAARERRREYEAAAKEVNKVRSRAELEALLAGVEADISAAAVEGDALEAALQRRRAQFGLILGGIADLDRAIVEEKGAPVQKAAAAAIGGAWSDAIARATAAVTSRGSAAGATSGAASSAALAAPDGGQPHGMGADADADAAAAAGDLEGGDAGDAGDAGDGDGRGRGSGSAHRGREGEGEGGGSSRSGRDSGGGGGDGDGEGADEAGEGEGEEGQDNGDIGGADSLSRPAASPSPLLDGGEATTGDAAGGAAGSGEPGMALDADA